MHKCVVHGAGNVYSCYRHFTVVNCTTVCSMNLLQAPNQHHFEVLTGVDWATYIVKDSPYSNVWGNKISRISKTKMNIDNSKISSSNYVVLYVHV